MNNVLRAGLYERVSTQEQALHGYSIDTQRATLEDFCKEKKFKIVGHYTDEGISGAKSPLKRPSLKKLLDDVQAGKIDIIIFTKLDRWFRSIEEYYKVQEILEKYDVPWQAVLEDYNTATADGRLKVNIMLSVAANERERASERIKVVFEHKLKNKEVYFSAIPWGYKKQKDENGIARLVKDEETQDLVQEFWDLMVKYNNLNKVGTYMNRTHNLQRSMKSWRDVKFNEFYTGHCRGVEDFCEPYVSHEDWLKITEKKNVKKTQNNRVYLFTGLFKCPSCGKILCSTSTINHYGVMYKHYRCKGGIEHLCDYNLLVSEKRAEQYLLDNLEKLIKLEIESVEVEKAAPVKKRKTDVAALKEKLRKLNVIYMAGNKSDSEYIQESNELKALIAKAESEDAPAERDLEPLKKLLKTDFRGLYDVMTEENKRRFWRGIIKEIHVEGRDIKEVIFL